MSAYFFDKIKEALYNQRTEGFVSQDLPISTVNFALPFPPRNLKISPNILKCTRFAPKNLCLLKAPPILEAPPKCKYAKMHPSFNSHQPVWCSAPDFLAGHIHFKRELSLLAPKSIISHNCGFQTLLKIPVQRPFHFNKPTLGLSVALLPQKLQSRRTEQVATKGVLSLSGALYKALLYKTPPARSQQASGALQRSP